MLFGLQNTYQLEFKIQKCPRCYRKSYSPIRWQKIKVKEDIKDPVDLGYDRYDCTSCFYDKEDERLFQWLLMIINYINHYQLHFLCN